MQLLGKQSAELQAPGQTTVVKGGHMMLQLPAPPSRTTALHYPHVPPSLAYVTASGQETHVQMQRDSPAGGCNDRLGADGSAGMKAVLSGLGASCAPAPALVESQYWSS
jgi:hypothetical protein